MPTIISLFPYELVPIKSYPSIESILESETQTPITVTDMSQSGTLPPTLGMEHVESEQAPPRTANYSQCHSERSEDKHTDPLHERQKETRRVSDRN